MKIKKRRKVLPYLCLFLFFIVILLIINYDGLVYELSSKSYNHCSAKISNVKKDGLLGIVPTIEVEYGGIKGSKVLITPDLWLHDFNKGDTILIYVNKISKSNFILIDNFFNSYWNLILSFLVLLCLFEAIKNLTINILRWEEKRYVKKRSKRN